MARFVLATIEPRRKHRQGYLFCDRLGRSRHPEAEIVHDYLTSVLVGPWGCLVDTSRQGSQPPGAFRCSPKSTPWVGTCFEVLGCFFMFSSGKISGH